MIGREMKDRVTITREETTYARVSELTSEYLRRHPAITNRELRSIAAVSYDDAIRFLGRMVHEGQLIRVGKSSGTRYLAARKT